MSTIVRTSGGAAAVAASASATKSLTEFRGGTDPDWTIAFTLAAQWSHDNKRPVFVPEASSAYLVTAPTVLDQHARFFSAHVPSWTPEASGAAPSPVISPTTGFPSNRGLFEIGSNGRSTGLRGLALRGAGFGTNVHGVVFPGITGIPELGATLEDVEISNFTGDGIRGGARVAFLRKVYIHECLGYGFNMNQPWNDSRIQWLYCFYNKSGGLNIDSDAAMTTITQSRFERSGQVPYEFNTGNSRWSATAPGIRIRAGANLSFVQCDTDANNGPGLDVQVTSATPTVRPRSITFAACTSNRDGQGAGDVTNTTSTGILIKGFTNVGGQNVPRIHLTDCITQYGTASDDGSTTAINPARGIHVENTEFCSVVGGEYAGVTVPFYFGSVADPQTANWRLALTVPQAAVLPVHWTEPDFHTPGMFRYNVTRDAVEKWDGAAWTSGQAVVALTDAATVATDASASTYFRLTMAGNRTLAAPTNPTDGQTCTWEVIASGGARTLTLATGTAGSFQFGTTVTGLTATTSGLRDLITATYSAASGRWLVRTVEKGF